MPPPPTGGGPLSSQSHVSVTGMTHWWPVRVTRRSRISPMALKTPAVSTLTGICRSLTIPLIVETASLTSSLSDLTLSEIPILMSSIRAIGAPLVDHDPFTASAGSPTHGSRLVAPPAYHLSLHSEVVSVGPLTYHMGRDSVDPPDVAEHVEGGQSPVASPGVSSASQSSSSSIGMSLTSSMR